MGIKSELFKPISGDYFVTDSSRIDNLNNKYTSFHQQNFYIQNSKQVLVNPFITRLGESHMYYSDSQPLRQYSRYVHSPVYNAQLGYICIDGTLDSPSKKLYYGHIPGENNICEDADIIYDEFKEIFDPREESNMPMFEKVNKWIQDIPIKYNIHNLTLDYYPAVTSYSSSSEESEIIDFSERDTISELQARRITRYATRLYVNEEEPVARFCDMKKEQNMEYELANYSYGIENTSFEFYNESREEL